MKGLITLTLLVATFLGGYHLGRVGAFGDLSGGGDKALKAASQLVDGLRKFAEGVKNAPKPPETGAQPAQTPQPAQIDATRNSRPPGQDAIVLHINGKRYVVCEGRRR